MNVEISDLIYLTFLFIFFSINLRILKALNLESKFKRMKTWEIRAAYFILALFFAHEISAPRDKISEIFANFFNIKKAS